MNTPPLLSSYQSAAVRDLAWALLSPQLCRLTDDCDDSVWSQEAVTGLLQHIDRNPLLLSELPSGPGHAPRLGLYFESLIGCYLDQSPSVEELYRNLRVQGSQRTLGEFDALYRPAGSDSFTHLETCVKFYLTMDNPRRADRWLGLNPSDSLSAKIARMRNHQLRLAELAEARELLQQQNIRVGKTLSLFRGRLFYPLDVFREQCSEFPADIAAEHLRGWWLRAHQLAEKTAFGSRYLPLSRLQWLAPVVVNSDDEERRLQSAGEVAEAMSDRPLMVARMVLAGAHWQEQDRGILLPRHWPDLD